MKKLISAILCFSLLFTLIPFTAFASETEAEVPVDVPQLHITTVNGNGLSLQKEDGYTDARFWVNNGEEEHVIVKVRGNSTAMTSKKSFTFKFDAKKELFGMGKGKKWVLLANPFDPTLLRNYVAFDFAQELGLAYTSQQKYVELWLDGKFRGCYTLMEPVQEGKDRVNIDIEGNKDFMIEYERLREDEGTTYITVNGLRFGISEPDEPDDEQVAYITQTVQRLTDIINRGDREEIEENIDIRSFAKFYLLNEFIKTNDFNFSSVFFYYKDGKFYAGPPWDYDLSMGNVNKDFSANSASAFKTDGLQINDKLFYKKLCSYDWFMLEVRREYARHADYIANLYPDGVLIDTLAATYSDVFHRYYTTAGWSMRYLINVMMIPLPTYEENLAYLKNWCAERDAWLSDYYDIDSLRYLIGDCDGNGVVDISDANILQTMHAEQITDENGDIALRGGVTGNPLSISDVTAIQRYLADFPSPYPIGKIAVR